MSKWGGKLATRNMHLKIFLLCVHICMSACYMGAYVCSMHVSVCTCVFACNFKTLICKRTTKFSSLLDSDFPSTCWVIKAYICFDCLRIPQSNHEKVNYSQSPAQSQRGEKGKITYGVITIPSAHSWETGRVTTDMRISYWVKNFHKTELIRHKYILYFRKGNFLPRPNPSLGNFILPLKRNALCDL